MINWKGLGSKRPWPNRDAIPNLPRGTNKNHKTSDRIGGILVEIRIGHTLNTSKERYHHTSLSADLIPTCIIFEDKWGLIFAKLKHWACMRSMQ